MRVLLVDNHRNDLIVNRDFFIAYGHKVDCASSAEDAMMAVKESPYDVVLMEINLPEDTGLSLIKTFSELEPPMPVYVLTEGISVARAIKAIKLNAIDVILKPLNANKLTQIQDVDLLTARVSQKKKRKKRAKKPTLSPERE